jgi:cytidine deaminase
VPRAYSQKSFFFLGAIFFLRSNFFKINVEFLHVWLHTSACAEYLAAFLSFNSR